MLFLLVCSIGGQAFAQDGEVLPEIDAYYKLKPDVRIWFQAKDTREAGDQVRAEIGPSLDFYLKLWTKLSSVTVFDLDDSKKRPVIFSIGYRVLPAPGTPPVNRLEPVVTLNFPLKYGFLVNDRSRGDLDWQNGNFSWRYRNRLWVQHAIRIGSYHPSPYVAAEFFYTSQFAKWSDTAINAGCLFPIGQHVQFNPYYEHQNNTGKSPNQQLNQLGLMLNLYFGK